MSPQNTQYPSILNHLNLKDYSILEIADLLSQSKGDFVVSGDSKVILGKWLRECYHAKNAMQDARIALASFERNTQ